MKPPRRHRRLVDVIAFVIAALLAYQGGAIVWADESTAARSTGTLGFAVLLGYVSRKLVNWWRDRGRRCERCNGEGTIPRDFSSGAAMHVARDRRICPECFGRGRVLVELYRWN